MKNRHHIGAVFKNSTYMPPFCVVQKPMNSSEGGSNGFEEFRYLGSARTLRLLKIYFALLCLTTRALQTLENITVSSILDVHALFFCFD